MWNTICKFGQIQNKNPLKLPKTFNFCPSGEISSKFGHTASHLRNNLSDHLIKIYLSEEKMEESTKTKFGKS